MVRRPNHNDQPSNPTSTAITKSSWQIHHPHAQAINPNEYFGNISESLPYHHHNDQSNYWKQLLESGTAIHNERKNLSVQNPSSKKSLAIAPESCASYPNISVLDESLLDGRRSAPPDFQELQRSQHSDTVNGSSSSSSSSWASELSSSSLLPELGTQSQKKTYLDAALTISNFKQEPRRQPSSCDQGQPSGDKNSENIGNTASQKRPSLKPPSGSTNILFKFGTVDESLVADCSQYSAVTFISRSQKARNSYRSLSACKPSSVLPRTMSCAGGLNLKDTESQAHQARPLLRKYSAKFIASVANASGNNLLERCDSCSNPLKQCCSQTILTTVLAKSSST